MAFIFLFSTRAAAASKPGGMERAFCCSFLSFCCVSFPLLVGTVGDALSLASSSVSRGRLTWDNDAAAGEAYFCRKR